MTADRQYGEAAVDQQLAALGVERVRSPQLRPTVTLSPTVEDARQRSQAVSVTIDRHRPSSGRSN